MFNVSESDGYFFYEYAVFVICRAEFVLLALLKKDSCDEVRIIVPKLKDIPISVIGVLVGHKLIMLFNVEIGLVAVSPHRVGDCLLNELPLLFDEVLLHRLISHESSNLIKYS